jgi:hypothetical protein
VDEPILDKQYEALELFRNDRKESFVNDANANPQASQLAMRRHSKNLVVTLVVCLLFSTGILAQNAAQPVWQGVLRDAAGVPIHGAGVHLVAASGARSSKEGVGGRTGCLPFLAIARRRRCCW